VNHDMNRRVSCAGNLLGLVFVVATVLTLWSPESQGLGNNERIRYHLNRDNAPVAMIVEGEIKPGDAKAFLEHVKAFQGSIRDVHLMSPGGSALEAMEIGRIIRALKMTAWAPLGSPSQPFCAWRPLDANNCTCTSSCFLLYVAGIERHGEVLGIHRVFVGHDKLKTLSASEALEASREIKRKVSFYFSEMGVPPMYLDRATSTPSGEIDFLSKTEIQKYFSGFIPEYAEWVTAKCGDQSRLYSEFIASMKRSKYFGTAKTVGELARLDPEVEEKLQKQEGGVACTYRLKETLSKEAYRKLYK